MTDFADEPQRLPPRFSLVNIHREAVDLTPLLDGASTPGTTWTAAPQGTVHGLSVELNGQRAVVALDPHTFAVTETASDAAPGSLRKLARETYLRYLRTCLSIGAFSFEAVPVESADGTTRHDSLRLGAVHLGARWLEQLPTMTPAAPRRLPLLSELTVIDAPPPTDGNGEDDRAEVPPVSSGTEGTPPA